VGQGQGGGEAVIYARFNRLALAVKSARSHIEQLGNAIRNLHHQGLVELAFYLNPRNPQELYLVSLWLTPPHQLTPLMVRMKELSLEGQVLVEQDFRLVWLHDYPTKTTVASGIFYLSFRPDFSPAELSEFVKQLHRLEKKVSEVKGVWVGSSSSELVSEVSAKAPLALLIKVEWSNRQSRVALISAPVFSELLQLISQSGASYQHGSTELGQLVELV
jgi:hypothetical protein